MVQAEPISYGILNFLQVMLSPVEQTMAQGNLVVPVLSATLPEPSVLTDVLLKAGMFHHPENQSRLITSISNLSLEAYDGCVDLVF